MSYGLKFLVVFFLIYFTFISTVSSQILGKFDFHIENGAKVFGEKEIIPAFENDTEKDNWKIKPEFNDSKRRFFTKQKEVKEFEKPPFPILPNLPEKFNEKPEFSDKSSGQNEIEPTNYKLRRGEKEINFEFGISPFHPTKFGAQEYDLEDRKLGMITLRWGRVFGTVKTVTYQYLFEASPVVYSYRNELRNPNYISPTETANESPTIRGDTYGVAVTPVSLRTYFFSKNRLKPFGQFGVGMIFTNNPMPLPESTWYNFTGYFGGGAMYHVTGKQGISIGYRYYHLSNFNTSDPNLGYNANTFSLGYSFFYGK